MRTERVRGHGRLLCLWLAEQVSFRSCDAVDHIDGTSTFASVGLS
jgi:hypothetical protein